MPRWCSAWTIRPLRRRARHSHRPQPSSIASRTGVPASTATSSTRSTRRSGTRSKAAAGTAGDTDIEPRDGELSDDMCMRKHTKPETPAQHRTEPAGARTSPHSRNDARGRRPATCPPRPGPTGPAHRARRPLVQPIGKEPPAQDDQRSCRWRVESFPGVAAGYAKVRHDRSTKGPRPAGSRGDRSRSHQFPGCEHWRRSAGVAIQRPPGGRAGASRATARWAVAGRPRRPTACRGPFLDLDDPRRGVRMLAPPASRERCQEQRQLDVATADSPGNRL